MTVGEPLSLDPEQNPAIKLLEGFFTEAYSRHLNGENTVGVSMMPSGHLETIAINPTTAREGADNAWFLITAGALDVDGFSLDTGNGELEVRYSVLKIIPLPDNTVPIQELTPNQLCFAALFYVNDEGQVSNGSDWFSEQETASLISLMETYELAPTLPSWAQENGN